MTAPATVADLGLERLVRLEQRITGAEENGLRARWEFGHELLAVRGDAGRLPNGYLADVVKHSWLLGQIALWVLIGAGWCLRSWDLAYQAERQAAGLFTRRAPP